MNSINDSMENARLVIWNAHEDETIRVNFEPFGYDETRHLANKELYNQTSELIAKNAQEQAEWRKASEIFKTTLLNARQRFTKIRQYLKFWYDADSQEAIDLNLYSDKISKYADFKYVANTFYSTLLTKDTVLAKLLPFDYTRETVQEHFNELNSLDDLRNKREQEGGEAQYAIKERNAKMDELDECVSEMIRLARLIFQDDKAQHLEKFGIVVRS